MNYKQNVLEIFKIKIKFKILIKLILSIILKIIKKENKMLIILEVCVILKQYSFSSE